MRSALAAYAFAIAAVGLVTIFRLFLEPELAPDSAFGTFLVAFLGFSVAVAGAAWIGGFGPSCLALVLSVLSAQLLVPGGGSAPFATAAGRAGLGAFILIGLCSALLGEGRRRARKRERSAVRPTADEGAVESAPGGAAVRKGALKREDRDSGELGAIYRAAPVGLGYLDAELRFRRINERLAAVTGLPSQDYLGRTPAEVLPGLGLPLESICRRVLASGDPFLDQEVSDPEKASDPLAKRWLVSIYPVSGEGGRVQGANLVVQDLAERNRAIETQLRMTAIVESSDDAIVAKDLNGIITDWNQSARRIFGYTSAEAIGRSITMLIPAERLGEEERILEKLKRGERVDHFETVRQTKDGRRIDVSLTISPIKDPTGRIIGASKVARDITERKRTETALRESEEHHRQLTESLREADRRKDEFLAMLAHELRNPLATVLFAVEALRLFPPEHPAFADSRKIINERVKHISHLLDDLLDVSRISRGKIQLRRVLLDLATAISSAVEVLRPRAAERGVALTLSLPPQALLVRADPTRMDQVISNLLSNAIKYTPRGGRIEVVGVLSPGEAQLTVKDTGMGIPADLLPRIFEPFVQGKQSLDRSQGGLGIGLTLVKSLVELHGGTVEVRSDGPGKGAEFRVRIPTAAERAKNHDQHLPEGGVGIASSRRVLVVEDNVDSALLLAQILKMKGHQVQVAHDGLAGIAAARAQGPEVVLLDIGLPGMDGYEVARSMRRDLKTRNARLVALTGYGQEEDRRRSKEAGFDEHLVKPVDPQVLEDLLASLPVR